MCEAAWRRRLLRMEWNRRASVQHIPSFQRWLEPAFQNHTLAICVELKSETRLAHATRGGGVT